jgi:integrase
MKRLAIIEGIEWHLVKVGKYWHAQRWVSGKRVTRSTKQTSQSAAVDVIRTWGGSSALLTAQALTDWLQRREKARGRDLSPQTVYERQVHWENFIAPRFDGRDVSSLTPAEVEDWAYSLECSDRYRQAIVSTFKGMIRQLMRSGVQTTAHLAEVGKGRSRKPDVFTDEQIYVLFGKPDIWSRRQEPEWLGIMLQSLFALMTFGGLRPQEARAVHKDQVLPDLKAVLVTRSITGVKTVSNYNKKGNEHEPRYRGTILSDHGYDRFYRWAAMVDDGPIYTLNGILRKEFLGDRLKYTCHRLGYQGRFTPYSCRYTFITKYKPILDQSVLMTLAGHVDPAMPERYNRPHLVEQMRQLQTIRPLLNGS